jgi:hypothetical protein
MDVEDSPGAVHEDDQAVHLEPPAREGEPRVERDLHLRAGRMDEGAGELGEELLEAQAVPQEELAHVPLADDGGQAEQRYTDDPGEALEREGGFARRQAREEPAAVDGGPESDGGQAQQGEARPRRPEAHRAPEERGEEQDERQARETAHESFLGPGRREDEDGDGDGGHGEQDGLDLMRGAGAAQGGPAPAQQHDDGGDEDELAERVREESVAPHRPEMLSALPAHDPRVEERREEGGDEDGGHEEDAMPRSVSNRTRVWSRRRMQ